VQHWLRYMPADELLKLLLDGDVAGTPNGGMRALGFNIRRALVEMLAELRPTDFTEEALGKDLYRCLMNLGESPRVRSAMSVGPILPGPVLFVSLRGTIGNSGGHCMKRVQLRVLEPVYAAAPLAEWPGRLWHRGHVVERGATRQKLLMGASPDSEVVVFHESNYGREAFDATLERALGRTVNDSSLFCMSLDDLMTRVRAVSNERPNTRIEIVYNDHNELRHDIELKRGGTHCFVIAKVRDYGRAAKAGLGEGWILSRRPDNLIINPNWHSWKPLDNLVLRFSPPFREADVLARFEQKPFGFSWSQDGDGDIRVAKVDESGRASAEGVEVGMVLKTFKKAASGVIFELNGEIAAALRDPEGVPCELCFVPVRRAVPAQMMAGVVLKEVDIKPEGEAQNSSSDEATREAGVQRRVVVAHLPAGHPAENFNLGVLEGWQLIDMSVESASRKKVYQRVKSLEQLPVELRGPFNVSLEFTSPSPLVEWLPLDLWHEETLLPDHVSEEVFGTVPVAVPRHAPMPLGSAKADTASAADESAPEADANRAAGGSVRSFWPLQYARQHLRKAPTTASDEANADDFVAFIDISAANAGSSSSMDNTMNVVPGTLDFTGEMLPGKDYDCEVLVLGSMPPARWRLRRRISNAQPREVLAHELGEAFEAAGRNILEEPQPELPPLVAAAVRWRCVSQGVGSDADFSPVSLSPSTPSDASPDATGANADRRSHWRMGERVLGLHAPENWLGGLVLGESVTQILFRCCMIQENAALFQSVVENSLRPAPTVFLQRPTRAHEI